MVEKDTQDIPLLNRSLAALEKELDDLKLSAQHIEASKSAAQLAIQAAEKTLSSASMLATPIQELIEKLGKVDFPNRLDKLDTSVSALQTGFQNIQARVDGLERTLKDEVKDLDKEIGRLSKDIFAALNKHERSMENHSTTLKKRTTLLFSLVMANTVLLLGLIGLLGLKVFI